MEDFNARNKTGNLQNNPAAAAERFSTPNRGELNSFLNLPSNEGMVTAGALGAGRGNAGVGVDPGYGVGRPGVGVGAEVGVGRPGVGVGGVGVGANEVGVARPAVGMAGLNAVTPSTRYLTASSVRNNYNNWGMYNRDWYARYPGAWYARGWTAGAAWNACTWPAAASYFGYASQQPVYYDYGTNVTYQGDNVYVDNQPVGTTQEYYNQATTLATNGMQAEAPPEGEWLPLGVFAFTKPGATKSDISIQLAVNKQGIIRGNYTDTALDKSLVVQGSVDKQTQKVAFTVGDQKTKVIETGLYNLTKDEAPALLHLDKDHTEQWLLVRMTKPEGAAQ
jgi:hypothetical protein